MRKLVLQLDAGIAGTNTAEAYLVPEYVTQKQLNGFAWERAVEHAESFGMYPESQRPEDCDDEVDSYTDDIAGWFEEYDAKKHNDILIYGANSTVEWNEFR